MRNRIIALVLVAAMIVAVGAFAFMLAEYRVRRPDTTDLSTAVRDGFAYEVTEFSRIDGWRTDATDETIPALIRSCDQFDALPPGTPVNPVELGVDGSGVQVTLSGVVDDWFDACKAARELTVHTFADENARISAARAYYEYHFQPVRLFDVWRQNGVPVEQTDTGLVTAYYEPFHPASDVWTTEFSAPVYMRPEDLVTVDLGRFRSELAGQRIAGRLNGRDLEPYPDHAAINGGALAGRARVLAYMRPNELFFLQIQGSGRLLLKDRIVRVGYDGGNGQPYTAIGRVLIDRGAIERENVSMKTILDWLENAPDEEAQAVRESNKSYVFFRELEDLPDEDLGPVGSQGVQLTSGRSIAIDPRYTAYGAPVWISIPGDPSVRKDPIRRLLIAQDSGGAIKGAVRADIFVGSGDLAGDVAGEFKEHGEIIVLVPKKLAAKLPLPAR